MKRNNFFTFMKGMILLQLFLLIMIAGLSMDINASYLNLMRGWDAKRILLPFSDLRIDMQQAELLFKENNLLLGGSQANILLTNEFIQSTSPEIIISSHIQALAYTAVTDDQEEDQSTTEEEKSSTGENILAPSLTEQIDPELFKDSRIYFYCTHSAESYVPDSGQARLDGKKGLINKVASILEQECNNKGLPSIYLDTIHDYPDYNKSYSYSRKTVNKIINSNKNIQAVFDIHRDSVPKVTTAPKVRISGKNCSQILIIVGTDERKPHPKWKENYQFAQELYRQGEKMYPGLIRGVRTKAGTYNQEFHPHALLLEFGTDYNTLEEASNSARFFTNVLLEVLKEEKK